MWYSLFKGSFWGLCGIPFLRVPFGVMWYSLFKGSFWGLCGIPFLRVPFGVYVVFPF